MHSFRPSAKGSPYDREQARAFAIRALQRGETYEDIGRSEGATGVPIRTAILSYLATHHPEEWLQAGGTTSGTLISLRRAFQDVVL